MKIYEKLSDKYITTELRGGITEFHGEKKEFFRKTN